MATFSLPGPLPRPGAYMRLCMYKYAYMYGCICMHRRIDVQTVCMSSMYAHTVAGASISMCAYSHATIRRVLSFHLSTGMWYASCYSKKRTMQTRRYARAGPLWGVFVAAYASTLARRLAPNLATYPQKNPQTYPQCMVWFLLRARTHCLLCMHLPAVTNCYKKK